MKVRPFVIYLSLTIVTAGLAASVWQKLSHKPKEGFVPDERTAIAIAIAVWTPIYGEKQIAGEKPYTASLKDGIWTVQGTLPKGWLGGVAIAEISKEDGRVIAVIHQQ